MINKVDDAAWYKEHAWIQTYTGQKFHFMEPQLDEICIEDIAHSLSLQCRYAGHVKRFYSVAEHCVHISQNCSEPNKLWGLLHDASEAYVIDIPRPVKGFLTNYKEIELNVMLSICKKFGLPNIMPTEVHEFDNRILFNEKVLLAPVDWGWSLDPIPDLDLTFPWSPAEAEARFLFQFNQLTTI